jgi:hypothetical protein
LNTVFEFSLCGVDGLSYGELNPIFYVVGQSYVALAGAIDLVKNIG